MPAAPSIYDPNNTFLQPMVARLGLHPKRVVFPEGNDERVLRAAAELVKVNAVSPILLGSRKEIAATALAARVNMDLIGVVNPVESSDFTAFCERYRRTGRYRRMHIAAPEETMSRPSYYAGMMLQYGYVDAMVGGNQVLPSSFFRALFHMVPRQQKFDSASSCLPIRLASRPDLGSQGIVFLADCAVIPSPTFAQLAMIAVETARLAGALLRERPRVALLSFSTRGSARNNSTDKMRAATVLARKLAGESGVEAEFEGEIQLDAAINPAVAERKAPGSPIKGRANVLVFPDLNSSHIASKLLLHVSGADTFGHSVIGLTRPAAQVSRVADAATIFGAAVCSAYRAIQYRELVEAESLEL